MFNIFVWSYTIHHKLRKPQVWLNISFRTCYKERFFPFSWVSNVDSYCWYELEWKFVKYWCWKCYMTLKVTWCSARQEYPQRRCPSPQQYDHIVETQQQETTLQDLIPNYNNTFIKYNLVHEIWPTIRPSRLGPNTKNNYKISSTRSNKIQLTKPILATPDT